MASTDAPRGALASRLAALAEAGLLSAVLAAPWPYGGAPDWARYALASALLVAAALWCAARAAAGDGLPRLALAAAALPGLAALQLLLGTSLAPARTAEAALLLCAGLGALLFWAERGRERAPAYRLAAAVLAACAAQAVFGAVQWGLGPTRLYGRSVETVTLPFGSYVNHNHFAGLVEMGALLAAGLALGRARRDGEPTPVALALGGLALGLAAVHAASRSRGGLLALVGGLLALAALAALGTRAPSRRRGRVLWTAGLGLGLVGFGLAAAPPATREHLATLLRGPSDASGAYRVDIARATLALAAGHPLLGAGFGAYPDAITAEKRGHGDVLVTHAESDALELLAEGGIAGLLAAGLLAAALWRGLRDRLTTSRDPLRQGLALGAAAGVSALLVHSLGDFNLRLPANALVFASLAGLAAAPRSEPDRPLPRWSAVASAVLGALLALGAAHRGLGSWRLEQALLRRAPQLRAGELDAVLSRHPLLAEARLARAQALRLGAGSGPLAPRRLARAEADVDAALALRPLWAEAWCERAWLRLLRDDGAGARRAADRAVALDPMSLQASAFRAEILARSGDVPGGLAELRRLRGQRPWTLGLALAVATRWTSDRGLLLTLGDGSASENALVERFETRH